jgi:hypothetical protein
LRNDWEHRWERVNNLDEKEHPFLPMHLYLVFPWEMSRQCRNNQHLATPGHPQAKGRHLERWAEWFRQKKTWQELKLKLKISYEISTWLMSEVIMD